MAVAHRTHADGTRSHRAVVRDDGRQITGQWTTDLEAARADEAELRIRRDAGRLVISDVTLADFLEADVQRREAVSKRGTPLAATSARRYREDHERICSVPVGGKLAGELLVRQIRAPQIEAIRDGMLERGTGARTVAANISRICTALERAVRDGVLPHNPATAQLVDRPVGAVKDFRADIGDRAPEILRAAMADHAHPYLDAAVHLALLCGLRLEEIAGLKWSAVDLEAGTVAVREVLTREGWRDGAKSSAGVRVVPLPIEAADALRRQQSRQLERLGGVAETVIDRRGGAWTNTASIGQTFGKLAERSGFGDVTFHGLRHGFTQILLAHGVTVEQAQALAGWSRAVMFRYYAPRISPAASQRIAAGISAHLTRLA